MSQTLKHQTVIPEGKISGLD